MEIYRTLNGPYPGCPSYDVLQKMYREALPKLPVDITQASLKVLDERDSKMFFPKGALKDILDETTIRKVLDCRGENCCGPTREKSMSDFPVLVNWVFHHARILLAVLIYLGHNRLINSLKKRDIGDESLDKVTTFITDHPPAGVSPGFAKSFERTLDLFRPPVFVMGNPEFTYEDNRRFPYIHDEPHNEGSFGKVSKFEIHPDYLDKSLSQIAAKYSPPSGLAQNSISPRAVFARKTLKYKSDESEFDMEKQVLRIIDEQRHDNIIDLVAFYSWRGELNCVFPFVALNLHDVLHKNWRPESMAAPSRFPNHWLWQQMILVADALQTIHNLPKQRFRDIGIIVGFHFDLKPKNILVTPDGILKITDFGQSMVKMVEDAEYAYETYVGGDFAYGPPEVAPTRNEIKELVLPPSLQSSRQLPDPSTSPLTASRKTSFATSGRHSSIKSIRSPSEFEPKDSFATSSNFSPSSTWNEVPKITVKANYDVWSLACIMTEVLVFIFEDGADSVKGFEGLRREEKRDLSFHVQDCLKKCVKEKFDSFRVLDHPDATFTLGQPRSYLSDIVRLLEKMFAPDAASRWSSARVHAELKKIDENHKEDDDPDADIFRAMKSFGPVVGFKELGYWHSDGILPFYNMAGIKLEINDSSVVECRLQLFRKAGAIHIRIRYGERFMNDESHTFDTNDSLFCPLYLFDTLSRHICHLKDRHQKRTFHFNSRDDLMGFQTTVMKQKARRGIRVSEVELQPKNRGNETYQHLDDPSGWGRCQVWQAENPCYVPAPSSVLPLSPQPSGGSIHVLFFSPKAFFGVPCFVETSPSSFNYAQALLLVLYSYDGWENAAFVAGEISAENPGTLRRGFIWAVAVVGILYMMLNAVFLAAIPFESVDPSTNANMQLNYAAMFSRNRPSATRGWAIITAISSAGSANTVIYTFSRVKQSIGRMDLLPWSSLWKSDYEPQGKRNGDQYKTPLGGLLLEFGMTVVMISASAAIPGGAESVSLPGNLQTFAHCFILIILGLGLFRLRSRRIHLDVKVTPSWFPRVSEWGSIHRLGLIPQGVFILIYAGMNTFIFVATGLSKTDGIGRGYSLNGKWYPTIVMSVIGLGLLYYFAIFAAHVPNPLYQKSLMQVGNVTCDVSKKPDFVMEDERARRFGHRRNISIKLNDFKPKWRAALFWFFGGYLAHSPLDSLEDRWNNMNRKIRTHVGSFQEGLTLRGRASQSARSGEGEISRENTREGSHDETHLWLR